MNAKNRLIERLLTVAKKHKVLTYPVLALMAIISFISYFFSWSRGAGKRIIAIIMVMVMLVSQSYFLTTSAENVPDNEKSMEMQDGLQNEYADNSTPNAITASEEMQQPQEKVTEVSTEASIKPEQQDTEEQVSEETMVGGTTEADTSTKNGIQTVDDSDVSAPESKVEYNFNYMKDGSASVIVGGTITSTIQEGGTYVYDLSSLAPDMTQSQYTEDGCYTFSTTWYADQEYTRPVTDLTRVRVNNGAMIRLFCKRTLEYCKVTVRDHDDTGTTNAQFQVSGGDLTGGSGTAYRIPIGGTMEITNISRFGYQFDGAEVTNGSGTVTPTGTENNSVSVSFTGDTLYRQVTLKWVADSYTIRYSLNEDGTSIPYEQSVTFDGTQRFLAGETVGVEEKAGYKFKGWKIGQDGDEVEAGTLISSCQGQLYQTDVILYPQYEYDGIKVEQDDIHYQFEKPADPILIQGSYMTSKADSSHFTYAIIAGSDTLAAKGITATATGNGISLVTSGPNAVTTDPIALRFTITDNKAPEGIATQSFLVNVYIDKRKVTIKKPDSDSVNKTYDGTTDAHLGLKTLETDIPGITVNFGTAAYNSPNVKDANQILLGNVSVDWGDKSQNNYEIEQLNAQYYLAGRILPRAVYVKTSAEFSNGRDYVRTGEKNPEFKVEVVDEKNDPNIGFLNGDSIDGIGKTFSTDRSENLMQTGKYEIQVEFPADSNYKIAYANNGIGKFEVKQENPELDVNYQITGDKGNGDWYIKNLAVSPIVSAGYDTIRVSMNGGATYTSGSSINLEEKDSKKGEISIQLYDSKTGAVTSWKTIEERIDQTPPKFISYSISQGDSILYDSAPMTGGLYFPTRGMLTFGTYFNRTVTVTVRYQDTASGLSTLHYGLYGAEITNTALFGTTDEDGYATATFEIYQTDPEQAGEINFYATDVAGNDGAPLKLARGAASDWSVELSGPVIEDFHVMAGKSQQEYVENGSGKYYSNCTAVVDVQDTISGIYGITWYINGTPFEERVSNTNVKQTEVTFEKKIKKETVLSETGEYSIYAVIEDNAGNEVTTSTIQFKVDDEPPVIDITSDYDTWQTSIKLEFDTYDTLSGVDYVNVTDADGNLLTHHVGEVEDGIHHCSFEITKKGTYYIIAVDKAGNINKTEIHADKVSSEIPKCPDITITPEDADGNDGWYKVMPSVTVSNVTKTGDDTKATTKYQLWKEGETNQRTISLPESGAFAEIAIPDEGIYNLKTWSESITGIKCTDAHECQIKVDTVLPKITYTTEGIGSTILVNFEVTDTGSGIDSDTVKVLHGTKEISAKVEETDGGYIGSFVVSETGAYSIQASDMAGNFAEEAAFTPMSMKVKAVTNISEHSAVVGANIIKGSFDITRVTLSYKKVEDKGYMEADSIINPGGSNGNVALSAILTDLSEATIYAYKVMAVSAVGEVLEYEGYFRTLSTSETGISVNGTARYADSREGTVTVGLFKGNVCYRAMDINAGDEFIFNNVPDGNYSIVATDGTYSKTKRILIKDGAMVYPETYIDLILSGKNTSVVITTTETPDVTADNMDSIFDYDEINFTNEDVDLIEVGGTVEFKLYATLMPVSNVSANEISAMYDVTDHNKIVGAYLDLSLYKVVTDSNGYVKRSKVTELANGANVSVTIPLGEMSGKSGLEVIRIHDTGDSNYLGALLPDRDNNPNTYTVTTNQFSTYAVLYNREEEPSTEDSSTEDSSTEDKDTSTTEEEKPNGEKDTPTTEDKNSEEGKDTPTTEDKNPNGGKNIPTTEDKNPNGGKDTPATGGANGSSVGSLRSSGTAQTGDETPIAVMGTMMLLSMTGIYVLKRKTKQQIRK